MPAQGQRKVGACKGSWVWREKDLGREKEGQAWEEEQDHCDGLGEREHMGRSVWMEEMGNISKYLWIMDGRWPK